MSQIPGQLLPWIPPVVFGIASDKNKTTWTVSETTEEIMTACLRCHNLGVLQVEVPVSIQVGTSSPDLLFGIAFCSCPAGQRAKAETLAARDMRPKNFWDRILEDNF